LAALSHALIIWTAPGAGQSSTLGLPGTIDVCDLIQVGKEISIGLLNLSVYLESLGIRGGRRGFFWRFYWRASVSVPFAFT
jgi:hypothetical protein